MNWQEFFAQKFPFIAFDSTPLYVDPLFPCPWACDPAIVQDISKDVPHLLLNGVDVAEILISWIAHHVLSVFYPNHTVWFR